MKNNVLLRSTLLCATLLCSISTCPKIIANQMNQEIDIQEMQQSLEQFELMYQEITKAYDQKDIEKYEELLFNELTDYLSDCSKNKKNAKNTNGIEQTISTILKKLSTKTSIDHAYATVYTMFISSISNSISQIDDEMEEDNLNYAINEIDTFMEKFFTPHMQEILEKYQA